LLCLAIGLALPIAATVLVLRRARRQLATSSAYREVARGLGLEVDTRGVSLHGVRDGRVLWVGEVLVGHGPERRTEVHGVIALRRPLGPGVVIRRKRSRKDLGLPLGEPELEKALVARAHWAEGLDALLEAGGRAVLRGLLATTPRIDLTDARLRLRLKRPPAGRAALGALVEQLEQAAAALEAARAHGPPVPAVLTWDWEGLARRHGLDLDRALPRLHGFLGGWPAEILPTLAGGRPRAWVAVRFAPAEDTGLRIHPQRQPDGDLREGQDIELGHPVFDAAFVVKGYDPEAVRARIDASVRRALLALHGWGIPALDDHQLIVDDVDPHVLDDVLEAVAELVAAAHPAPGAPRVVDIGPG
jgi:hypothetical protein